MDFEEALRARALLLRGLDAEDCWARIGERIAYNRGATALLPALGPLGIRFTATIFSGGFREIMERAGRELGFDSGMANRLEVDAAGRFTGRLTGTIMTPLNKRLFMQQLAEQHGVPACNVVCMGDGANDIPMIEAAGVGVAYNGKPLVRERARYRLDHPDLSLLLELFAP